MFFWNINDYKQQHNIKGYDVQYSTHMIELSNGDVALSSNDKPFPIIIIDGLLYQVKKKVQLKGNIISGSSLCVFN